MNDVPYHGDAQSAQLVRVPLDRNTPAKHWLFVFRGEHETILHRYEIDFGITKDLASCIAAAEGALAARYDTARLEQSIPVSATASWQITPLEEERELVPNVPLDASPVFREVAPPAVGPSIRARLRMSLGRQRPVK